MINAHGSRFERRYATKGSIVLRNMFPGPVKSSRAGTRNLLISKEKVRTRNGDPREENISGQGRHSHGEKSGKDPSPSYPLPTRQTLVLSGGYHRKKRMEKGRANGFNKKTV